jgi:hypothetical protein
MVVLEIDVLGDVQVARAFRAVRNVLQDLREPVFKDMTEVVLEHVKKQFSTEGMHASGGWDPLSPAYAAWKADVAPGAPILVLSGDMREALTRTDAPDSLYIFKPLELGMGSSLPYWPHHQLGVKGRLTQRRIHDLTEQEKHKLTAFTATAVGTVWRRGGRGRRGGRSRGRRPR